MKAVWVHAALLGLSAFATLAAESAGGAFVLAAPTAAGGGGTSTGGQYALTGTAGQADAGTLAGGAFTLVGGFIGVLAAPTVGGDATLTVTRNAGGEAVLTWDQDGYVLEFRAALGDAAGWQAVTPPPAGRTHVTPANLPARFFRLRKP